MAKIHISSGGVIYRVGPQNKIEILLLHQRISKKWHLPKGTQEGKESLKKTALREVEEETGFKVEIEKYLCKLPSLKEDGSSKITHYFLMKPVEGDFDGRSQEDKNKYDRIEWVEIEKAKKLLSEFKDFEKEEEIVGVAERFIKEKFL